jgi:uncharacterized protein (TIGR02145 family)
MQKFLYLLLLISVAGFSSQAQSVGIGTTTPNRTAQLDVQSNNKGFLPPRMTLAQRNAISNPAAGLMLYCTDCGTNGSGEMNYYNGTAWISMNMGGGSDNATSLPRTTVGPQVVTTKNLDVVRYRNGDPIPQVTDSAQWANLTTGAWCWYNNDSVNYSKYGRLYNAYAVNDPRLLAPVGWRVMNEDDWNQLVKYLDPNVDTINYTQTSNVGEQLKDTAGWKPVPDTSCPTCINGNNSSGFSALPGGVRYIARFQVGGPGGLGVWWSQNQNDSTTQKARLLYSGINDFAKSTYNKKGGFSVRLIREQPAAPPYRPIVKTGDIINIDTSYAIAQGTISYDGSSFIVNKGFCWSTSQNPTIDLPTKSSQGNGNEDFSYTINDLTPCTVYHVRAFGTNSVGTSYGENKIFLTNGEYSILSFNQVNQLLGDYANTNENFNGSPYGPYTTNVRSITQTSATTANMVVENIFDAGWAPITFKMDWTDPANRTVTLDLQTNIAPASTVSTNPAYSTWLVQVAPATSPGTFRVCDQTIQLNMRVGLLDPATGQGGFFGGEYIINMAR